MLDKKTSSSIDKKEEKKRQKELEKLEVEKKKLELKELKRKEKEEKLRQEKEKKLEKELSHTLVQSEDKKCGKCSHVYKVSWVCPGCQKNEKKKK